MSSSSNELDCVIGSETVRRGHWGRFEDYAPFIKRPELAFEREYRFVLKMAQIDQPSTEHDSLDGGQELDNEECERTIDSPIVLKFREGLAGESIPYLEVKLGEAIADLLSATRRQSRAEEKSGNEAKEGKEKKEVKENKESVKHRITDMGDAISMLCVALCIFGAVWNLIHFGPLGTAQEIINYFDIEELIVWVGVFAYVSVCLFGAELCLLIKIVKRLTWSSGVRVLASIACVCVVAEGISLLDQLLVLFITEGGPWRAVYPMVCTLVVIFGWHAFLFITSIFLPDDRQDAG